MANPKKAAASGLMRAIRIGVLFSGEETKMIDKEAKRRGNWSRTRTVRTLALERLSEITARKD
jgi:hypothetical protein